jgi:hypothetical protein
MQLMVGAGILAALVLGLVLLVVMRKGKGKTGGMASPPLPESRSKQPGGPPPPPYVPTAQGYPPAPFGQTPPPHPFEQPPPPQPGGFTSTSSFGQPEQPRPFTPTLPQPSSFSGGSVYQPLPPEPASAPGPVTAPEPNPQRMSEQPFHLPSKGNPAAWLVCIEGQSAGRSFPIEDPQFWIGASPNNHLQLGDDLTVSGNHACIAFEQDGLEIYDHKSTNGIYLNDQRLNEGRQKLRPGDKLRVGRSTFVVQPGSTNRAT